MTEMTSEITELLAQAMRAIQYGHKPAAAAYLNRILEIDPDNMDAWRWLAECMPNPSKRDYCLERAGLAANNFQTRIPTSPRSSAVFSQSSMTDFYADPSEPTLAEKHAQKAVLRGQKRAELPPHYHTSLPVNIDYPKSSTNPRRTQRPPSVERNSKSQNVAVTVNHRQIRQSSKKRSGKGLFFSILIICVCTVSAYVLFSTGLTTGTKVWNWISLQIKNNTSEISFLGNGEKPTESPYNQPAEVSILATYFPTPVATPQPDDQMPAVGPTEEADTRVSAEAPGAVEASDATSASTSEDQAEISSASEDTAQSESSYASNSVGVSNTSEDSQTTDISTNSDSPAVDASVSNTPSQPTGFVAGPIVIGKSVKGNNIEIMQFGNGPVERMMVAGIHGGNEWNTTALADQLIEYLQKNPKVIPADRTLYILRLLNPDGEARGHNLDGRTNERGVDLNRNWDAFWVVDWPRDGCWNYRPISAGSSPFSEPETTALRDFLLKHKVSALINYHSAALGVFAGGRPPETESVHLAKSIAAVTNYAYPPTDTGCDYTGQFADWLAMHGTAAVDLELSNHTDTDFDENLKVLNVLLKWEPSTGPKSLTGLINLAQTLPEKPTLIQQISKFGAQTINELNGFVFGRQEEK